jgi:predicted ATPase/transcriptional regulator with XRE-family HTH domain
MIDEPAFGSWMKRRRRQLDLTQQELADCAGCSIVTVRKLEVDERKPSKQLALQLAACLQIPPLERDAFLHFARAVEGAGPPFVPSLLEPVSSPAIAASGSPVRLPASLTSLVGRTAEIEAITALLAQPKMRLLTLTGPGGSGKTRLALAVARRLAAAQVDIGADGVYFVDVTAVTDPTQLIPAIAAALNLKENPGQTILAGLIAYLQPRHLLLLLDNFEQVVAAAPDLFTLLQAAPELQLLVTSRESLHLYGEHEFPVPPLLLPPESDGVDTAVLLGYPAIALFMARAIALKPAFQLTTDNATAVVEICRRLDGLPLALELAAARVKYLAPAALLTQLGDRLTLTTANQAVTARQRTLHSAIEWSFNLLNPQEQALFAHLGVFAGTFSLAAAAAVNEKQETEADCLTCLLALVDKNMVQMVETADVNESVNFRLLQTMREYAYEELIRRDELAAAQTRHAHYYLSLAEAAVTHYEGPDLSVWLHRLQIAHDNCQAALAWSVHNQANIPIGLTLATALTPFWQLRNHLATGRRWLTRLLAAADDTPAHLRAAAYRATGQLAYYQQDYRGGEELLQTSLALWQSVSMVDDLEIVTTLGLLGRTAWAQEAYEVARTYYEQTQRIRQQMEDPQYSAQMLYYFGLWEQHQGHYERANRAYEKSLAIDRLSGNQVGLISTLNAMGTTAQEIGQYTTARALLGESLSIAQALDNKQSMAMVIGNLGNVAWAEGKLDEARAYYGHGLRLAREVESRTFTAMNLFGLGTVALLTGDDGAVGTPVCEALALWHELKNKRLLIRTLDIFALLFCRQGGHEAALNLLGYAETLREKGAAPPRSPAFQPFYEQAMALAQAELDSSELAAAWQHGRSLALAEIVALATAACPGRPGLTPK